MEKYMKIKNRDILISLFFISNVGYITGTVNNSIVDPSPSEIFVEEEVRLLEKDLNGDAYKGQLSLREWNAEKKCYESWISQEDLKRLLPTVRKWLILLPEQDLYSNPALKRTETNRAVGYFVGKEAARYAAMRTNNQKIIANAEIKERQEIMDFLTKSLSLN